LVRLLHWLEEHVGKEKLSEWDVVEQLERLRAEGEHYRGQSFYPIVAYGPNAAVVHYKPQPGGGPVLRKKGLLLLDTGGQYWDGTTDVTRTITLGEPRARERRLFTRVLQGHIGLARAIFPQATAGARLEALAREHLWPDRLDYGHGTGHGVGHYLNVHEGPMGFAPRNLAKIEAGNVLTIEPGYYESGRFGIRTENMVVVVHERRGVRKGEKPWLRFDPLTLCPIDLRLVDAELLSPEERDWLNGYHVLVRDTLAPLLEAEVRVWLELATRPV
jgi:Xaa-Pro aminopeptidase